MKVTIDTARCQGHGRCYSLAPEVFDADDEGFATVRAEDTASDLRDRADLAAANCPEDAITVEG